MQSAVPKLETFQAAADKAGGRLMDLGKRGEDATPRIGGLAGSLKTVDGALASMGVHIGPEIKALGELGDASGKTASQLGLVTSAGFVLAAGIGGWKIGRLIADVTGSDKAIGDWVANMMGWGDELQRAGAKADVLARASKNAGHEITDFNEAVKINAAAAEAQGLAWGRSANAARDTAIAVSGWQREIRGVRSNGDIAQLTLDLDSQNFTLKELGVKYGVSVGALGYFTRAQKETATEVKATTLAHEAMAKSVREYYNWVGERAIEHEKTVKDALAREAADYRAFSNEMGVRQMEDDARALAAAAARKAAEDGAGQSLMDAAAAEHTARVAAAGLNEEVGKTPAVVGAATGAAQQASQGFFQMSEGLYSAIRAAQAMDTMSRDARMARGSFDAFDRPSMPHFAAGGPVLQDGPIYAHAGEYVVPKGGGGGTTINIYGNVLSTKAELARLVEDALVKSRTAGGGRMPA